MARKWGYVAEIFKAGKNGDFDGRFNICFLFSNMLFLKINFENMLTIAESIKTWTVTEYLSYEKQQGEKYEYRDGSILIIAGGSINHNRIAQNLCKYLDNALENQPQYQVFGSDQKIYLPKYNFYVYADALVVAASPIVAVEDTQAITNPIMIVEVLSKSTEQADRNQKFLAYRSLTSLLEYVLVRQDAPEVLTFFRTQSDLWQEEEFIGLSSDARFKSLDVVLPLEAIFRRVEF